MKKVEMHCHILPGIDDGAEDMKQSLQMLHIAMEHEIVGAIVTPHGSARDASRERTEKIRKLCRIFRAKAEQQFDVIFPVFPGQEILYSSDTRRLLDEGKLLTLADTRYVLVEFMPEVPYSTLFAAVRELRMAGYVPILTIFRESFRKVGQSRGEPVRLCLQRRRSSRLRLSSSMQTITTARKVSRPSMSIW